jgi:hypothetical protein
MSIHDEQRTLEIAEARTQREPVECPECGSSTTALAIAKWGSCRPCRTAQSRTTDPLRW